MTRGRPPADEPLDPERPATLLRVQWRADQDLGRPVPWLRVRQGDDPSRLIEATGLELNYKVAEQKVARCIGRPGFRLREPDWIDCNKNVQGSGKNCVSCSIAEAGFASGLHHAHTRSGETTDPDIAAHLAKANVLYLAGFRDRTIKVGTSTLARRDIRWCEQGAWSALQLVETPDGISVRHLEDLVTKQLKISQSVSANRKLTGMVQPVNDEALGADLWAKGQDVAALVDELAPSQSAIGDPWWFPGHRDPYWRSLYRYPNEISRGAHQFTLVLLCGRMAVATLPANNDRFAIDLGRLYGVELVLGRFDTDEIHIQDQLF